MIFNMTSPVLKSKDKVPVLGEDFTYSGSCEVIDDSDEVSGVQWRIKFYTSGTLVTNQDWLVDLFLVGGGGNGSVNGGQTTGGGYSGSGGGGGYTGTFRQLTIEAQQSYSIVVGGSAGATSALGQSVSGGQSGYRSSDGGLSYGGAGGSGGGGGGLGQSNTSLVRVPGAGGSDGSDGGGYSTVIGKGQGTTTREFGEEGATLYSGGGGGGNAGTNAGARAGGSGGGGSGGSASSNGAAGTANTGGGGGGAGWYSTMGGRSGGAGGSGIAIVRKARTTATLNVNAPSGSTVTAELNGKVTQLYESGGGIHL